MKLDNRDQIGRTEDFYLGTNATARWAGRTRPLGSSRSALLFLLAAGRGASPAAHSDAAADERLHRPREDGTLQNAVLDASMRYYVQQSKNWLFFTTLSGTKGWRLDLDNQILLGGDNGLRGYPLRYQDGTARALFTRRAALLHRLVSLPPVPGRRRDLLRCRAHLGRGAARAAQPRDCSTDAGFGLRFGNARSALGNVVHVDLAFPFNGATRHQARTAADPDRAALLRAQASGAASPRGCWPGTAGLARERAVEFPRAAPSAGTRGAMALVSTLSVATRRPAAAAFRPRA